MNYTFKLKNKQKAVEYSIFPTYLLMPLAISVGYGVILPVASPSNAILYTSGYLTIKDMVILKFNFISLNNILKF